MRSTPIRWFHALILPLAVAACAPAEDDGKDDDTGDDTDQDVTGNTKPPAPEPVIAPEDPKTGDTLRVDWAEVEDADGDVLIYDVTWTTDDPDAVFGAKDTTIVGDVVVRGQTWTVKVFARDGTARGPAGEASVTIANTDPVLEPVTISPEDPPGDRRVTGTTSASDADGDNVTLTYAWTVNGTVVLEGVGERNLPPDNYVRDDEIGLTVTADDGNGGTATRSAMPVTVTNTPPSAPEVRISPRFPKDGDTLTCEIVGAATDDDGDALTYRIVWEEDRTPFNSETFQTLGTDTRLNVNAGRTQPDEVFTCVAQANDGAGWGEPGWGAVTIDQAAPELEDVALGPNLSCAIRSSDDGVACWGDNLSGRAEGPGEGAFTDISLGNDFGCGVDTSGALACWGPSQGRTVPPEGTYVSVASGGLHSCAVATDLSVDCWGSDSYGESTAPEDVTAREVSVGQVHSCAITTDDELVCWGRDHLMQAQPPAGTFLTMSSYGSTSCAIGTDLTLSCWGSDDVGQATPPAGTYVSLAMGAGFGCAVDSTDDSLACWGQNTTGQLDAPDGAFDAVWAGQSHACAEDAEGGLVCWGDPLGDVLRVPYGQASSVSVGTAYTCIVNDSALVECWGEDVSGETSAPFGTFDKVTAGLSHTCGLEQNGTVQCWGDDTQGQTSVPSGTWLDVSVGSGTHSCGLDVGGDIQCWGAVQLGPLQPPSMTGPFDAVSAGSLHTCGIDDAGDAQCWGSSPQAILGVLNDPSGPFTDITSGDLHNCALKADKTPRCWGSFGRAGFDNTAELVEIAAGGQTTCGIREDGSILCWELAIPGLGTGFRRPPEGVFHGLSVGLTHACAMDEADRLHCWGAIVRQPLDAE